jgi:hypothetical protein
LPDLNSLILQMLDSDPSWHPTVPHIAVAPLVRSYFDWTAGVAHLNANGTDGKSNAR